MFSLGYCENIFYVYKHFRGILSAKLTGVQRTSKGKVPYSMQEDKKQKNQNKIVNYKIPYRL